MKNTLAKAVTLAVVAQVALTAPSLAGPLENLERERAMTIQTMLDASLSPDDRQEKLDQSSRRLVDLERMTMRDESLRGKSTPTVRIAFANYDLTFLVHASTENQVAIVDQWLDQFDLNSHEVLNARVGLK